MATLRKFSSKRCLKNCERLPDAHRRARCCADCLALRLAARREKKRVRKRRPHKSAQSAAPVARRHQRNRRLDLLFSTTPSTTATPAPPRKKKARSTKKRRRAAPPVAGAPPIAGIGLGDAESDRRAGLATSGSIAAAALIICGSAYSSDPRGREQCIAAVNGLRTVADAIITDATADGGGSPEDTAEIDDALEQMRLNLEDIEGQAQVDMQAKAVARRQEEEERQREEESTQNRNLLIGGGVVLAVLAAGAGYVLLKDDDEAA